ncbi:alpha/beta hydrolase [Glycomyces tenuis]|uniref:alpha/beta hydrolase n=1 Tax=Glycomyces tenuis TaxID=58116 RepID=UPI0003F8F39C|nr:alpha/beta hydrolase [Glycomyces tenuis]
MSIGFSALQEADFDVLAAVGERWTAFAAHLSEQVEALEGVLDRQLSEDHWAGDAPDAARERIKAAVAELEQRIDPAGKAAAAIADAVEAFRECQADLGELAAEAEAAGVVLGAEGDGDSSPEFAERLAAILDRATEVDEELGARIGLVADTAAPGRTPLSAAEDPAAELTEMLASGASPKEVNGWWDSLSGTAQDALVAGSPELVGSADGVPSDARDEANRRRLGTELQNLDAEISHINEEIASAERSGRGEDAEELRGRLDALTETRRDLAALEDRVDGPDRVTGQDHYLLGYDASRDGKAIIAIGNPDTADNTAVFVPGTGAELGRSGDYDRAAAMAHDAHEAAPREDTAMVMWLGYDAPDHPVADAHSLSYAKDASGGLSSFMGGLEAANRDPAHATTTVVGYSYGSTVVGQSAKEHGLATDQIIAVASPGMNVDRAADLGIDPDDVWATTAPGDVIHVPAVIDIPLPGGDSLGMGPSPVDDDFGARTFDSDAMSWNPLDIHTNYWNEGNAARDNMAFIVTGQTDRVH